MQVNAISVQGLTKRYGQHRGVEDLYLEVPEGEFFGFIGPNGAGKTTTIRVLLNLIFPTSGSATIFGKDVVREGAIARRDLGYVPADPRYYPGMSVRELLSYSMGFYGLRDEARVSELAGRLELDTARKIDELSTGNAKKVAIVQSLLHRPRLLILDEPTNGLDPLVQAEYGAILDEERARGTTLFFSSHVLSEVERLCKKVAIIKEGRIIASEDIAALRKKNMRKVAFSCRKELRESDFPGAHTVDFKRNGEECSFLYAGDSNALVRELAALDIHGLRVEEPSLEEIFMHYYADTQEAP